nr:hypothetical protein B0A51_16609 [Rachicladosporium sp. CCFEE 5018]
MDSPSSSDGSPFGDIPTRPMRVKVLYTFDNDNKTNCLARFPDTLQIPAVAIDENSQVGVIELRQCIQAIVSASPELLSRLAEGDFTIYAYDYSEYESPLVGQGMLSAALAAAVPTPLVPAHQSKAMITGRVCKNLPALFSNGVKETLEVKLRLVPVPKQVQNEYVRSMETLRSMSPATSAGFDPNAWTASLGSQQARHDYFQYDTQGMSNQRDQSLIDDIFGFGSEGAEGLGTVGGVGMAQTPSDGIFNPNPAFAAHAHSAPGSRAGSPMMGPGFDSHNDLTRHQSFSASSSDLMHLARPDSRASVQSESTYQHHRQTSTHTIDVPQQTEVYYNEDGQARKRAKVTQADWRGRSSFGGRTSDLRVAAATTASMQLHRPVPTRPSAPGSNLEPPPRLPTPVPHFNALPHQQRGHAMRPSSLMRQASTAAMSDIMSDVDQMSEAIISSPEDGSPEDSIGNGTPQDIPSSPPLLAGRSYVAPSSPGLPTFIPPRLADSGYMSERNAFEGSQFSNVDDLNDKSPDDVDYAAASEYQVRRHEHSVHIKSEGRAARPLPPPYPSDAPTSELNFEWEQPGDMNRLPQRMMLNLPPGRGKEKAPTPAPRASAAKRSARGQTPTSRSVTPLPDARERAQSFLGQSRLALPPAAPVDTAQASQTRPYLLTRDSEPVQSRRGSLAFPTKRPLPVTAMSDQPEAAKKRRTYTRARSTYNDSEAGSPAPSDTEGRPSGPRRSGSGANRRKVIEQKCLDSVAQGIMPQFCKHCGSIETPTWRNLYIKVVEGKPGPLDSVQGEGETIGVEPLEWNDAGDVVKFVIRKSMKKLSTRSGPGDGFVEIQVCNPCGLWFNKNKNMRPKEKWGKKSYKRKSSGHKRPADSADVPTDSLEPQSEAFYTDAVIPEDYSDGGSATSRSAQMDGAADEKPQRPRRSPRRRAHSMQAQQRPETNTQWDAAQRQAALARAIQSSPAARFGSQESPIELEELTPKPTRRLLFPSPRNSNDPKSLDDTALPTNKSPSPLDALYSPKSPTSKVPSSLHQPDISIFEAFTTDKENMPPPLDDTDDLAHLFMGSPSLFRTPHKTPCKTPKSLTHVDHLLQTPTPASPKFRKPLSPSLNGANNANHANDFLTSPSSSRYFLRSTPTRLAATPGRELVSPFSRQLAQMLSHATGAQTGFSSTPPSTGGFDFGNLPTFETPGREGMDWDALMRDNGDNGVWEDGTEQKAAL